MKTKTEIQNRIREIENDSRYKAGRIKPATIFANAPLALIQTAFESENRALRWVLQEKEK